MLRNNSFFIILFLLALTLFFLSQLVFKPKGSYLPEVFYLNSSDSWQIAVSRYLPDNPNGYSVIFIHSLNSNRNFYDSIAQDLRYLNFTVYTFDLRGHGESITKGVWQKIEPEDFQNMAFDLRVVIEHAQKTSPKGLILIGSSIGANLALIQGSLYDSVIGLIILSPGRTYRGISIGELPTTLSKPHMVIVSDGDTYSYETSFLFNKQNVFVVHGSSAHGENLYYNREAYQKMLSFVQQLTGE